MNFQNLIYDENAEEQVSSEWTDETGTSVEIYDAFLKVKNEKAWKKGSSRQCPIIASINDGDLNIFGFDILTQSTSIPQLAFFYHIRVNGSKGSKNYFGISHEKGISDIVIALSYLKKRIFPEGWFLGREYEESTQGWKDVIQNLESGEVFSLPNELLKKKGPDICPETIALFKEFLIDKVYKKHPSDEIINSVNKILKKLDKILMINYEK